MDNRISRLVEVAYALKCRNQDFRAFHVAAIFRKKRLISLACNSKKTHPLTLGKYPEYINSKGVHAESLAVIRAGLEDFSGHDLFVIRIDNENRVNLSKPCFSCSTLLRGLSFKSIQYSDIDGWKRLDFA